jgi:hypothetical protein
MVQAADRPFKPVVVQEGFGKIAKTHGYRPKRRQGVIFLSVRQYSIQLFLSFFDLTFPSRKSRLPAFRFSFRVFASRKFCLPAFRLSFRVFTSRKSSLELLASRFSFRVFASHKSSLGLLAFPSFLEEMVANLCLNDS